MSIFSDYECGAMSESEFKQECARMNREERDELDQFEYVIIPERDKETYKRLREKKEEQKMVEINEAKYEEYVRKSVKYDMLRTAIEQNVHVGEYSLRGFIDDSDDVLDLLAMLEPEFAEALDDMIEQKKAEVAAKKEEEAEKAEAEEEL